MLPLNLSWPLIKWGGLTLCIVSAAGYIWWQGERIDQLAADRDTYRESAEANANALASLQAEHEAALAAVTRSQSSARKRSNDTAEIRKEITNAPDADPVAVALDGLRARRQGGANPAGESAGTSADVR